MYIYLYSNVGKPMMNHLMVILRMVTIGFSTDELFQEVLHYKWIQMAIRLGL